MKGLLAPQGQGILQGDIVALLLTLRKPLLRPQIWGSEVPGESETTNGPP